MTPSLRLTAATLALCLAAPAAFAQGAAAAAVGEDDTETRRWLFNVDWGPVHLAEVELRVDEGAERVALSGAGRSTGLAAMVADFEVTQRSVYAEDGATRRYEATARWGEKSSRRALRWDGAPGEAGAPSVEVASNDPEPLTPIPQPELEGTVDPAWPIWDSLNRIEAGGDCASRYRVYDGVRRFDIVLEDAGTETVEKDRDWTWGGEALVCRLKFERVGGFPVDDERRAEESEYERLLYVARTEDGAMPVRLRVQWPLGYATARIDLR
jgi:hypothetical protein